MKVMRVLFVMSLLLAGDAQAWMAPWAPPFKCEPATVRKLPAKSVKQFVKADWNWSTGQTLNWSIGRVNRLSRPSKVGEDMMEMEEVRWFGARAKHVTTFLLKDKK